MSDPTIPPFLPAAKANRGRAFTLVELLVVIAIIALLAALLLPLISRVKNKFQGVWCENNLRQLQVAWHLYSDEPDGKLVRNQDRGTRRNLTWAAGWLSNTRT